MKLLEAVGDAMSNLQLDGSGIFEEANKRLAEKYVPTHKGKKVLIKGGTCDPETYEAKDLTGTFVSCCFWLCGVKKDRTELRVVVQQSNDTETVAFVRDERDLVWGD